MKKLLLILSFASLTIIADAQWVQTSLDSERINCLLVKGSNIFAGSLANGVYLSTNNGSNWAVKDTGLPSACGIGTLVIKGDSIFAATYATGIYLSPNNGSNWVACGDTGLPGASLLAIKGDTIFAGARMYLSTNNGNNWTGINGGFSVNSVLSIAVSDSNVYAGTSSGGSLHGGGVFKFSNSGGNWNVLGLGYPASGVNDVFSIAVSDTNIFAGTDGGIFLFSHYTGIWNDAYTGLTNTNVNALAINGSKIFAGTNDGVFLSTTNGNNWVNISSGLPSNTIIHCIAFDSTYAYIGTGAAGVWKQFLSLITGIKEINNADNIVVYPNPATNNITIEAPQKSTIEILNIQGQTILQQQIQQGKTNIDISALAKGVYILRLCSNDKTAVTKIVKE